MICSISVVPERGMPMTKIGIGEGSPPPDFCADQFARERRLDAVEQANDRRLVIGNGRALGRIAGEKMRERALVILQIAVGLAEREIELHAVGLRQAFGFCRQRLHRGKMRIAGREFLGVREIDVDAGDIRIEPDRLQIGVVGFLQLAELFEHVAHIVVGVGKVGLERKRAPVGSERGGEIAALEGDAAHQIDGVMIVGVKRERALVCLGGFVDLVLVEQHGGIVHEQLFVARLDDERAAHEVGGFVEPVEIFERQRQIVERVRDCWARIRAPCDRPSPPLRSA